MNIIDKNVLSLIAFCIDDKKTMFNFALVCKLFSRLVANLKPIKDPIFNHIDFTLVIKGSRRYCHWSGQYTQGQIEFAGTRVWFTPRGAIELFTRVGQPGKYLDVIDPSCVIEALEIEVPYTCKFRKFGDQEVQNMIPDEFKKMDIRQDQEVLTTDVAIWLPVNIKCVIRELHLVINWCSENNISEPFLLTPD